MMDFGAIGTATSLATRLYGEANGEAKRAATLVTELVAGQWNTSCHWRLRPSCARVPSPGTEELVSTGAAATAA
jgi:hypothetical protein